MIAGAEDWIRGRAEPTGPIEVTHERPWATVLRVPTAAGVAWFKACAPVQAFEVRLSVELSSRWPGLVADVLAYDEERSWLLLADAGRRVGDLGFDVDVWTQLLPRYAELQRGEAAHAAGHLAGGVPDRRLEVLAEQYDELLLSPVPLEPAEVDRMRELAPTVALLAAELAGAAIPASIQHDDLHFWNLFTDGRHTRVLDWGDSSVAHPFWSLTVPYRELDENGIAAHARLRDAYREPWGDVPDSVFDIAARLGEVAHACAQVRQRAHLPVDDRPRFDTWFAVLLRRAIAALGS